MRAYVERLELEEVLRRGRGIPCSGPVRLSVGISPRRACELMVESGGKGRRP